MTTSKVIKKKLNEKPVGKEKVETKIQVDAKTAYVLECMKYDMQIDELKYIKSKFIYESAFKSAIAIEKEHRIRDKIAEESKTK